MGAKFASGKWALAICDRCGFRYRLKELRKLTIKTHQVEIKVCHTCWEPDHPQLKLGMFPVYDPQALQEPRPDSSYATSGLNAVGNTSEGSRVFQWGWAPVGGASSVDAPLTPNDLVCRTQVGSVTITVL